MSGYTITNNILEINLESITDAEISALQQTYGLPPLRRTIKGFKRVPELTKKWNEKFSTPAFKNMAVLKYDLTTKKPIGIE